LWYHPPLLAILLMVTDVNRETNLVDEQERRDDFDNIKDDVVLVKEG
jgi:hypothetical protein